MISFSSSGCQSSTDKVFADGSIKLRTDDQICDLIANRITRFKSGVLHPKRSTRSLLQAGCSLPPSNGKEVPRTTTPFKERVDQQSPRPAAPLLCTFKAVPTLKEDTSRAVKSNSESRGKESPQTVSGVPAAEKPVVITIISAATSGEGSEDCTLSQEEHRTPDVPRALNQQLHLGTCKEGHVHFRPKPSVDKTQSSTGGSSIPNQVRPSYLAGCEMLPSPVLKDPQYEDISDDEDKFKLLRPELFEDISEDEGQSTRNSAVELSSPRPGANSQFGSGPAKALISPASDEKLVSETQRCSCVCDASEHRRCLQCVHESDLTNYDEEFDSQSDDDWDVIPVDILNLTLEEAEEQPDPENTPQDDGDEVNLGGGSPQHSKPALNPISASAFQQMEVFDTRAEQEQAVRSGQLSFVTLPSFSSNEKKSQSRNESGSEPEDSYDTEDSCDYSSGPESNYLTVSKQVVSKLSPCVKRKADQFEFENKNEGSEKTDAPELQAWTGGDGSKDDIINLDSDSDRDCMEITEREEKSPSSSDINKRRPSPEIIKGREKIQKIPVDPPGPQQQKEVAHSESSKVSQGAGPKSSGDGNVVIVLSDSDDDACEIISETKGPSPLKSANRSNTVSVKPKSSTAKSKLQEPRKSSGNNSKSRSVSQGDKPKVPGKIHRHESNREGKKNQAAKRACPLKEDVEHGIKAKKVQITLSRLRIPHSQERVVPQENSSVVPRMLVQSALHPGERDGGESSVQRWDKGETTPTSSTDTSNNDSRHSLRDRFGRFTPKSNQKRRVHTPIQYKSSTSSTPFSLQRDASPSSSAQSNHARKKIFSDWQKNHVPIRRERKRSKR